MTDTSVAPAPAPAPAAASEFAGLPPPPVGPPPRYASVVKRMYPYSLRPIVIFCAVIGGVYGIAMGVEAMNDRNAANASSRQTMMALIQAILYFIIALVEVMIVIVAVMQNVAFGKLIWILAPLGVALTLGAQITNVVRHFSLKSDLIAQCSANTVGASYSNNNGGTTIVNADQARTICASAWDRGTWTVIAWLIFSIILAGIFASLTLAYYRQLLDPSSVRTRQSNRVETYALQPNAYSNNPPPPHGGAQQSWMVPPYPGPPVNMSPQGYEKADYQPEAEWASYGPDGGRHGQSGFGGGGGQTVGGRAQDEAWARAEASGPTAHLTGNGVAPRTEHAASGYVVTNREEDEAWERARNEGVTAHLTGGGSGAAAG